ncbi:hypothetical protein [Erythrobacter sp. F6033]|uniref:hypothetical protein n=1 Tax=Erythrobacter sp. F6033 TaxID=2926401 RepID=UPI001FF1F2F3|nr:hypothetical protein [Erythrobacter sp. F6033]MCK0128178.1 hypothetical protein [Erythrobacter sp. F6033]
MTIVFKLVAVTAILTTQPASAPTPQPITFPGAAEIELGEWPLGKADPGAVEAMFRHEIVRMEARFGQKLDFLCLGYSYGQPTKAFFERFSDTATPLMGRLSCSPDRNRDAMGVLVELSTIRCEKLVCSAKTNISFGNTFVPGVPISAHKTPDGWAVRLQESK